MVLAPFGPAVTVDPSGPNQQSGMQNPPSEQGGTVMESQSNGDLDSAPNLQGVQPTKNPWQEFQQFAGELARIYSAATGTVVTPRAAVVRRAGVGQSLLQPHGP